MRRYQLFAFANLTAAMLYDIMRLRAAVFVVEQNSLYLDPDGYDPKSLHLCLFDGDTLAGYARLIPPGVKFPEASVGRVVLAPGYRGQGNGRDLMCRAVEEAHKAFASPIHIEAQAHLQKFYTSLGFDAVSEPYILDGILHINMRQKEKIPL